jgi:hypothetical protein
MLRTLALALVLGAAAVVPAAGAADQTGFELGRRGGNIRPFTVVIAVSGKVRATGPVKIRKTRVARLELGRLNRLAVTVGFERLSAATSCPGTLPDVAATFIRVGRETVRVHGTCVAGYQRLWKALAHAARLSY